MTRRPLHWSDTAPGWIQRKFRDLEQQISAMRNIKVVNLTQVDMTTLTDQDLYYEDTHTVTAPGAQTMTLTYTPKDHSEHLYWHPAGGAGIYWQGSEWSRSGITVTIPDPDGIIQVDDKFVMEYAYLVAGQPTPIPPPPIMLTFDEVAMLLGPAFFAKLGDQGTSTAVDDSGNGRDGTYVGSYTQGLPELAPGLGGTAVEFSSGYVTLAPAAWQRPAQFSAVIWFNADAIAANDWVFGVDDGSGTMTRRCWYFHLDASAINGAIISGSTPYEVSSTGTTMVAGETYMATLVFDESTLSIYLNDNMEHSIAAAVTMNTDLTLPLTIGAASGGVQPYDGRLQKAILYDYALTAGDVADLYAAGVTP